MAYEVAEIKDALEIEDIFELLQEWGGEPEYTDFGIISATICHNPPGEGSHKLYYYDNSTLFRCYTGCNDTFDIFELCRKVASIQWHREIDLNEAVRWVAFRFGIISSYKPEEDESNKEQWETLDNYQRLKDIEIKDLKVTLKEYDSKILDNFNYNVKLTPWLKEGISKEAMEHARIGFYPGGDQITIPHYDKDGRFIGLRGRTMCKEEAERFGKYRPIKINGVLYNHPLGMNLYNLNNSKNNIKILGKAIIFESEKSCLMYQSYFGLDNDISVACCGSSVSAYQVQQLLDEGAKEIIIGFDRQFQALGDKEFEHLTDNLKKINKKYKNYALISFIFDKKMITGYKASPIDEGKEKFLTLFKDRIIL